MSTVKKNKERYNRKEHLTNWYMINLCWGILGMFALTGVYRGYRNMGYLSYMQPLMWVFTGIFAVAAVVLFVYPKIKEVKNSRRFINYGIFMCVCTVVSLWLALYNILRPIIEKCARVILSNPGLMVNSYWNVRVPMILIAVYLVAAFIWYVIEVNKK